MRLQEPISGNGSSDVRFSYLNNLACSVCHHSYEADQIQTISPCCSRPLLAHYDLATLKQRVTRGDLGLRQATMWRYHELLPIQEPEHIQGLGEGMTPLL